MGGVGLYILLLLDSICFLFDKLDEVRYLMIIRGMEFFVRFLDIYKSILDLFVKDINVFSCVLVFVKFVVCC